MALIYKITNNINNKVYIGKTNRDIQIRWSEHKRYIYQKERDNKLYRAIRKYGIDNFSIDIIENNISEKDISNKEKYYIKFYDSYYSGYNETFGGEGESQVDISKLITLYNKGYNYAEISRITGHTPKTISNNLQPLGYLPKEKIKGECRGRKVVFNNKEFLSLTSLAIYLQKNIDIFKNKKIETIIKGISKNTKKNKPYCGYYFSYIYD